MIPLHLLHWQPRQRKKFRMQRIVSKDNKRIKRLKGLAQKKVRIRENLFLIEGVKMVDEATSAGLHIDIVVSSDSFLALHQELLDAYEKQGHEVIVVSDDIFSGISSLVTPQGVLAAVSMNDSTIDDIISKGKAVVLLDGISDPGNLGTIMRTADAFGFSGILMTGSCVDIYNPKTVQATMGSILRVAHSFIGYGDATGLKDAGYTLYGFDLKGMSLDPGYKFAGKSALIIGNESTGISAELLSMCDELVKIPMSGNAESLNAAIAAGIAMFLAGGYGKI